MQDIPDPYETHEADAVGEAVEELCYHFADFLKRLSQPNTPLRALDFSVTPPKWGRLGVTHNMPMENHKRRT